VAFVRTPGETLPPLDTIRDALDNIVEATAERPLRLYHCLNEDQFNKCSYAPEPRDAQWAAQAAAPLRHRLQQFALCIPDAL
jgi:hypothetical protein